MDIGEGEEVWVEPAEMPEPLRRDVPEQQPQEQPEPVPVWP